MALNPMSKNRFMNCTGNLKFRRNDKTLEKHTRKSVQEDNFENKIVLATKISQNFPVRRIYFTLQVL